MTTLNFNKVSYSFKKSDAEIDDLFFVKSFKNFVKPLLAPSIGIDQILFYFFVSLTWNSFITFLNIIHPYIIIGI